MFSRIILFLLISVTLTHAYIFIPMNETQDNHLKAYGLAYKALELNIKVKWLLNYKGGSFVILQEDSSLTTWAITRNVTYEIIGDSEYNSMLSIIEEENMNTVELDVAPNIAVYAPEWAEQWDDAVTLVLEYSEIPYTQLWDEEVLSGQLTIDNYDWLHLHHEDFTGQFGKFWFSYGSESWYITRVVQFQELAEEYGFTTVQEEKKAVAVMIKSFVEEGGFLFAMCAATDTIDIALSSIGVDIIPSQIDGTEYDSDYASKLNFTNTIAFENFSLVTSPYVYEFSDIDIDVFDEGVYYSPFLFTLNEFSAKYDVIPTMLVQNHNNVVGGFLGQTTAFYTDKIKKDITILNNIEGQDWVTYIHGDIGEGTFTFLGGHDPEDYTHLVGDPPTNLDLFPNSAGYRLILNNILFPAANTKKRKT